MNDIQNQFNLSHRKTKLPLKRKKTFINIFGKWIAMIAALFGILVSNITIYQFLTNKSDKRDKDIVSILLKEIHMKDSIIINLRSQIYSVNISLLGKFQRQEESSRVIFWGKVIDADNSQPIPDVEISFLGGTLIHTNPLGEFNCAVNSGERAMFSFNGYKQKSLSIDTGLSKKYQIINLKRSML